MKLFHVTVDYFGRTQNQDRFNVLAQDWSELLDKIKTLVEKNWKDVQGIRIGAQGEVV